MSELKPYPAYKDSGIEWLGEVPEGWDIDPLGRWFVERKSTVSDEDYAPLSVTKRGILPQLDDVAKTDNNENRKLVKAGDFAINSRSDRKGSSGVSAVDGSVSVITTVLTPRGLDSSYLHHLLRSVPFQEEFYRWGHGIVADLWSTKWSDMKGIRLPIPSLSEQQSIADFLDRETAEIDSFVQTGEQLIELLNERRAAVIAQAVTKGLDPTAPMKDSGIEWLGEVPEEWEITRVSYWYDVLLGKMLDEAKFAGTSGEMLPYVRAANIGDKTLNLAETNEMPFTRDEATKFSLVKGDLLVVEGGSVGQNTVLDHDMPGWGFQKTVNRVRPKSDFSTAFLGYGLDVLRLRGVIGMLSAGSTIAHLTAEKLGAIALAWPPPAEQDVIVAHIEDETARIDKAIAEAHKGIELAKERRQALISAAVTGKIDVREAV